MNWRAVARREVIDLKRSRGVWIFGCLSIGVGLGAVFIPAVAIEGRLTTAQAMRFLVTPLKLVIGLTGLLVGYNAVAGPRSAGRLKLTLGLPIQRVAIILGALLGRLAIVLGGTAITLGVAAAGIGFLYGSLPLAAMAGFALLLGLFAVTMTGLAVGISAACPSRWLAATTVVGAFVLFEFFWGLLPSGIHYLLTGSLPGRTVPAWFVLLERFQPFTAFQWATDLVLPELGRTVRLSAGGAEAASGAPPSLEDRVRGGLPTYLEPWVGVVVLFAWAIGPLVFGIRRFVRADLV
jgi:ABC-2 type transport system permease protein